MTTIELHGIGHELKFWKEFVQTERFIKGWVGNIKTPELDDYVADFIKAHTKHGQSVLDLGSGAVSILNGIIPDRNLVAVDPLGDLYECIFDYKKHKLSRPLPFPAEEIKYKDQFQIVHMRNAIDHSQDPTLVLSKMFDACRPGGYVIVHGFEDEATYENWSGFHQWNISVNADGHLIINSKTSRGMSLTTAQHFQTIILDGGKKWFTWIAQKPS